MMKRLLTGLKYLLYACTAGLTAYILYYAAVYSYLIYAIDKHDDQILTQIIKENDEYMKLSYVERYVPPINRHKNIPESAFWIPHNKASGYFVSVTVSGENKDLIHIEMYPDIMLDGSSLQSTNAIMIFKKAFQDQHVPFSRFTQPDLPADKVVYKLRSQFTDPENKISSKLKSNYAAPDEIQQALPNYEEYWYLEYPQGYLVMETDQD